jgi:hypothetical protein
MHYQVFYPKVGAAHQFFGKSGDRPGKNQFVSRGEID